jgi:hypothetical protein
MATMPKQPVTFRFGPLDQDTGDKHLRPGYLVSLENSRILKAYDHQPRRGYGRTAISVDTGSFTGAPDTYVSANGTRLIRDAAGVNFAYDSASAQFKNLGTVVRPFPTKDLINPAEGFSQPCLVRASGYDWTFVHFDGGYGYVVRDTTTNRIVKAMTGVVVSNFRNLCAVTDGTTIFLFIVAGGTTIALHRYTAASPTTAATTTTYQTIASAVLNNVDAMVDGSLDVYVVATSNEAANYQYSHSKLDKATGQAAASPAPVTAGGTRDVAETCNGCSWMQNAVGTTIYYSLVVPGAANTNDVTLISVTKSTLAISATTVIANIGSLGSTLSFAPATAGFWDTQPNVAYSRPTTAGLGSYQTESWVTTLATGLSPTFQVLGCSAWLATKPFLVGTSWYLVTGSTIEGQNAYHLRGSLPLQTGIGLTTGTVVAQLEYGLGPGVHNNRSVATSATLAGTSEAPAVYAPIVSGNDVYFAGISDGGAYRFRLNFAESYGPGVALGNKAVIPGPIPYTFGIADVVRELAPLQSPAEIVYSGSAGDVGVQVVYKLTDANGEVTRSSPGPTTLVAEADLPLNLNVPNLRHCLRSTANYHVEVYVTDEGSTTPVLRYVRQNSPGSHTQVVTIDRNANDGVIPEAIYTTGGALASGPPPICKNLCVWRDRLIASGTPVRGQIMPSQVIEANQGPRFNSILQSNWADTQSDIVRLEPVSWNDCAVLSTTHVGLISGNGPNGKGSGPYIVQTVPSSVGAKNSRAAVNGKDGCYFQGTDLRYYLLTPQLEEIGQGVMDFTSPVSTCLHDTVDHKIFFWLEDATILAFDYDHPQEEQGRGQWSKWASAALLRGYGAIMIGGVPEHIETSGARRTYQVAFTDTLAAGGEQTYDMILRSGDLAIFDLGHCFRVAEGIVHGAFVAACTLTVRFEFDAGASAVKTWEKSRTISAAPFQTMVKPSKGDRVQTARVQVTVTAAGGGAVVSGFTIVAQDRGITKFPNSVQRIVDNP